MQIEHTGGIDAITVSVNGSAIEVREDSTLLSCGSPTVTTTMNISYENSNGISDLILVDPNRLAPGVGLGDAVPEIEFFVTVSGGILSSMVLRDADGLGDSYTAGANGLNLNGDDDVDLTATTSIQFEGGAGNDVLDGRGGGATGAPFPERLTLLGGPGADQLFGGTQGDDIDGGPGDDTLDGGGGTFDEIDYSASTASIAIDLAAAGPQNAGSFGMDTIAGFEQLRATKYNDVLRGTDGDNSLYGEAGDDLIEGRGGDDFLDGGPGVDTASYAGAAGPVNVDLAQGDDEQDTGGAGKDYLWDRDLENLIGSAFADQLRGTDGVNRVDGGAGPDTIAALGGDDFVAARDGQGDSVDCGAGTDGGSFDRASLDAAVVSCELGAFEPEPDTAVAFSLSGKRSQRLRGGSIAVRVRCSGEPCSVAATASVNVPGQGAARLVRFRGARARLAANGSKTLRLKLGRRGLAQVKRALAAGSRLTARVRVTATDAAGNRDTERMGVRLRR